MGCSVSQQSQRRSLTPRSSSVDGTLQEVAVVCAATSETRFLPAPEAPNCCDSDRFHRQRPGSPQSSSASSAIAPLQTVHPVMLIDQASMLVQAEDVASSTGLPTSVATPNHSQQDSFPCVVVDSHGFCPLSFPQVHNLPAVRRQPTAAARCTKMSSSDAASETSSAVTLDSRRLQRNISYVDDTNDDGWEASTTTATVSSGAP